MHAAVTVLDRRYAPRIAETAVRSHRRKTSDPVRAGAGAGIALAWWRALHGGAWLCLLLLFLLGGVAWWVWH